MPSPIPYSEVAKYGELWQEIKRILKYLVSPQLQESLFSLKITFIFISVIFFSITIYFLVKTDFIKWWFLKSLIDFLFPKPLRKKMISRKWKKTKKNLEKSQLESQWKVNLIESLNIFDEILKEMDYPGRNLGEKLESLTEEEITNPDELLRVYKTCQDVIRDPDYRLTKKEAQDIFDIFEKALKDLELL